MFPSDVTEINDLVSFAKREGTVCYFHGPMPVFSLAESDRASFRVFTSQIRDEHSVPYSRQWRGVAELGPLRLSCGQPG